MEFERSIFRMHERLLLTRSCPKITTVVQRYFCAMFVYFLLAFIIYHKMYVNNSDILSGAIEDQILSLNSSPEYQKLPYSDSSDRFIFCNKVTFSRNDTAGLIKEAVKQKNETKEEATSKSNDELITELKYVPCDFSRDELFSVLVIQDVAVAEELKRANKDKNLTVENLKKDYSD